MGTNFYIQIHITTKDTKFVYKVCHIGTSNHIDFISLYEFFRSFNKKDLLFRRLHQFNKKLRKDCLTETDAIGFRQLLCDLYESYASDAFHCYNEYDEEMTFQEIITWMSKGHSGFEKYETSSYKIDGLDLNLHTGFL